MISYDIYLFHYYSFTSLINRCNKLNIEVKKYYVYGNDFYLKINRKYRKIVKDNFKDYKIVSKMGFINIIESLITKPITLISLTLAITLFLNLSNRIYDIEFKGDYPLIENRILEVLNNENIYKYGYNISLENIEKIETKIKDEFNDELESFKIYKVGAKLSVEYKKRRKESIKEESKNNIYASKDGVIKSFSILKGNKVVKANQFVKKGDLLIEGSIENHDDKIVYIGAKGSVYASTYYFIEISTNEVLNEVMMHARLLDLARSEVSKNINSDKEYIEKEVILNSDLKSGYMRVYYVLYEDITI